MWSWATFGDEPSGGIVMDGRVIPSALGGNKKKVSALYRTIVPAFRRPNWHPRCSLALGYWSSSMPSSLSVGCAKLARNLPRLRYGTPLTPPLSLPFPDRSHANKTTSTSLVAVSSILGEPVGAHLPQSSSEKGSHASHDHSGHVEISTR